jgi:glycosyltransferase involved in cell wall biosynthesis
MFAVLIVVAHVERRRPPRDVPRVLWYVDPAVEPLRAHLNALRRLDYPIARLAANGRIEVEFSLREPPPRKYGTFLWALRNFDIVVLSPARSLLRETPLAYHELQLLRKARRKVVVLPHGSEVRLPSRSRDLLFKHALSIEQPAYARAERTRLRDLEYVLGYADVIVSGADWVDSMPWWDRLSALPYAVDVDEWRPDASERLAGAPLVLHVRDGEPRGTEFLVRACDAVAVELRIADAPNEDERRRLIAEADVIAEQFVSGWYGPLAVEAMSMQKPVLSYLRDDLRELYVLFSFAEKCPVVSAAPEEVEEQLRALASDPARRAELGKRGREYVREHHSVEAAAATLDELFKTLWEAPA